MKTMNKILLAAALLVIGCFAGTKVVKADATTLTLSYTEDTNTLSYEFDGEPENVTQVILTSDGGDYEISPIAQSGTVNGVNLLQMFGEGEPDGKEYIVDAEVTTVSGEPEIGVTQTTVMVYSPNLNASHGEFDHVVPQYGLSGHRYSATWKQNDEYAFVKWSDGSDSRSRNDLIFGVQYSVITEQISAVSVSTTELSGINSAARPSIQISLRPWAADLSFLACTATDFEQCSASIYWQNSGTVQFSDVSGNGSFNLNIYYDGNLIKTQRMTVRSTVTDIVSDWYKMMPGDDGWFQISTVPAGGTVECLTTQTPEGVEYWNFDATIGALTVTASDDASGNIVFRFQAGSVTKDIAIRVFENDDIYSVMVLGPYELINHGSAAYSARMWATNWIPLDPDVIWEVESPSGESTIRTDANGNCILTAVGEPGDVIKLTAKAAADETIYDTYEVLILSGSTYINDVYVDDNTVEPGESGIITIKTAPLGGRLECLTTQTPEGVEDWSFDTTEGTLQMTVSDDTELGNLIKFRFRSGNLTKDLYFLVKIKDCDFLEGPDQVLPNTTVSYKLIRRDTRGNQSDVDSYWSVYGPATITEDGVLKVTGNAGDWVQINATAKDDPTYTHKYFIRIVNRISAGDLTFRSADDSGKIKITKETGTAGHKLDLSLRKGMISERPYAAVHGITYERVSGDASIGSFDGGVFTPGFSGKTATYKPTISYTDGSTEAKDNIEIETVQDWTSGLSAGNDETTGEHCIAFTLDNDEVYTGYDTSVNIPEITGFKTEILNDGSLLASACSTPAAITVGSTYQVDEDTLNSLLEEASDSLSGDTADVTFRVSPTGVRQNGKGYTATTDAGKTLPWTVYKIGDTYNLDGSALSGEEFYKIIPGETRTYTIPMVPAGGTVECLNMGMPSGAAQWNWNYDGSKITLQVTASDNASGSIVFQFKKGSVTKTVTIKVVDYEVDRIYLNGPGKVFNNSTAIFTAQVDGTDSSMYSEDVIWEVDSPSGKSTIRTDAFGSGVLTAVGEAGDVITVTARAAADETAYETMEVSIVSDAEPITGFLVYWAGSYYTGWIEPGETETFKIITIPAGGVIECLTTQTPEDVEDWHFDATEGTLQITVSDDVDLPYPEEYNSIAFSFRSGNLVRDVDFQICISYYIYLEGPDQVLPNTTVPYKLVRREANGKLTDIDAEYVSWIAIGPATISEDGALTVNGNPGEVIQINGSLMEIIESETYVRCTYKHRIRIVDKINPGDLIFKSADDTGKIKITKETGAAGHKIDLSWGKGVTGKRPYANVSGITYELESGDASAGAFNGSVFTPNNAYRVATYTPTIRYPDGTAEVKDNIRIETVRDWTDGLRAGKDETTGEHCIAFRLDNDEVYTGYDPNVNITDITGFQTEVMNDDTVLASRVSTPSAISVGSTYRIEEDTLNGLLEDASDNLSGDSTDVTFRVSPTGMRQNGKGYTANEDAGKTLPWTVYKNGDTYSVDGSAYLGDVLPEDVPGGDFANIPEDLWAAGINDAGYEYTGGKITPKIRVYFGKVLLTEKKDYTITYKNNVNAAGTGSSKAPMAVINGTGNYGGSATVKFTITKKSITDTEISVPEILLAYTGRLQKAVPVVYFEGKKLKYKTDFDVTYLDQGENAYKAAGEYRIRITGQGNFIGETEVTETITEATLLSKVSVSKIKDQAYTGDAVTFDTMAQAPEVTFNKKILQEGVHFTVSYSDNVEIGKATAVLTGTGVNTEEGIFVGTKTVTFSITGTPMNKVKVEGFVSTATYTGDEIEQDGLILTAGNAELNENVDYTIAYEKNQNVGTATCLITGIGAYSGTLKKTFRIAPYDFTTDPDFALQTYYAQSFRFVKGGVTPKPLVYFNGDPLELDKDYSLSYQNNTAVNYGENANKLPTIVIKGKGNFKGSAKETGWIIDTADLSDVSIMTADRMYSTKRYDWKSVPVLTDSDGKTLKAGTDYEKDMTYEYLNETVLANGTVRNMGEDVEADDVPPVGTLIKVTVTAKGNNYEGEIQDAYTITAKSIAKCKVTVKSKQYTGNSIILSVSDITVKDGMTTLTYGTDYEIAGYSNNLKTGTAFVIIRGLGDYGGLRTEKFQIVTKKFPLVLWD